MEHSYRRHLWNRAVLFVFAVPSLGYLGFLSQFVFGEPTGLVRGILEGLFLFALPLMPLYSLLLGPFSPIDQTLGTAGFFVFIYIFAVVLVWTSRRSMWFIRDRRPPKENSHSETNGT